MGQITELQMKSTPTDRHVWFYESLIYKHGSLAGRVTPAGQRLFYFRYLDSQAKQVNLPIGHYGKTGLSVAVARAKALELAKLHESGIKDIREHLESEKDRIKSEKEFEVVRLEAERRELEARVTVSDLFDKWLKVQISKRKDAGVEVTRIFNKDVLPVIGHLYLADINKGHITSVTDAQLERGTNRLPRMTFTLIRQLFRFALERDLIPADPTANIRKSGIGKKEVERDRVLSEDEIRDLYRRLPDADLITQTEMAVWLALSTCCRIGELLRARWEHVDLDKGTWLIPAGNSKNGKPHTIYPVSYTHLTLPTSDLV